MEINHSPRYQPNVGPTWVDDCWACGKALRPDRSNVCDYCCADQHRDFSRSPKDEERQRKAERELEALLIEISNKVKQERMKK